MLDRIFRPLLDSMIERYPQTNSAIRADGVTTSTSYNILKQGEVITVTATPQAEPITHTGEEVFEISVSTQQPDGSRKSTHVTRHASTDAVAALTKTEKLARRILNKSKP